MSALRYLLLGLGGLAAVLTAIAFLPSNDAIVRIWDFPRVQLAAILVLVLAASPWLLPRGHKMRLLFPAALLAALVCQVVAIWPYTPLMETQAKAAEGCAPASRVKLLTSNVLMTNDDAARLKAAIEETDPDIVFLVETDERWDQRMAFLKSSYPHAVRRPLDNTYGMLLYSRLPLISPRVRFLVEDDVPSIKTGVRLKSGARVDLYGLHPKPPPHQDTAQRDAELIIVAREVAKSRVPAIVLGDLNDVAWSDTTDLFQEISHLLDPRVGRGTYATFNANWPLFKWPLDHVFFAASFQLIGLQTLGKIGSDHLPVSVSLCFNPAAAATQPAPQPDEDDAQDAAEAVEEGREEEAEEDGDKDEDRGEE
jgi:endonuclease/exonuclease/phosphatase (EEP) superfamily protein YafD